MNHMRWMAAVSLLLLAAEAGAQESLPWSRQPLVVQLHLEMPASPAWCEAIAADFADRLGPRLALESGGALKPTMDWRYAWGAALWSAPDAAPPTAATAQPIESDEGGSSIDKLVWLRLDDERGVLLATAREWDVLMGRWGPTLTRTIEDSARSLSDAVQLVRDVVSPLARVERVQGARAWLQVRPSPFPDRRGATTVGEGDLFQAYLLRENSEDEDARTVIPWTFLRTSSLEGNQIETEVVSALRGAVAARRRSRTQVVAIRIPAASGATTLSLTTGDGRPAADVTALAVDQVAQTTTSLGRPNRRGEVVVPPSEMGLLSVVYVRRGDALLARLPLVPGLQPTLHAELRNDDARLRAEALLKDLQEQAVDAAAASRALAARIEAHLKRQEFELARTLLDRYRKLPTRQQLELELDRLRSPDADEASRRQIDRLVADTRTLIQQALDPQDAEALQAKVVQAEANRLFAPDPTE